MADEEILQKYAEVIQNQGEVIQNLRENQASLNKAYGSIAERVSRIDSPYPMYVSRTDEQMFQELQAKGVLEREKEGAGDNVGKTFRHFTQVTDKGELVPGLESKERERKPASIMETIETLSAANFVYQFTPAGYIFEFGRGAWEAIDEAKNIPRKILKDFNPVDEFNNYLHYLDAEKRLVESLESKSYKWVWDRDNHIYKLIPTEELERRTPSPTPGQRPAEVSGARGSDRERTTHRRSRTPEARDGRKERAETAGAELIIEYGERGGGRIRVPLKSRLKVHTNKD